MNILNIKDTLILVVDDSNFMRKRTISSLGKCGFKNIIEASNGKEAISLVDLKMPKVVFMDLNMPEMDGIEALTYIKKKYSKNIICIMISAVDQTAIIEQALGIGAYAYLKKPLNDKEISDTINQALEGEVNNEII